MKWTGKRFWAKAAVLGVGIPALLWAYETGPNPGYCGVPTEHAGATCTTAFCHTGTTNDPANTGSVSVSFPNGLTYTPRVKQRLSVTISDPAPTQRGWGFQLTARSGSGSVMAGSFAPADGNTLLMCSQESRIDPIQFVVNYVSGAIPSCPAGDDVQFIEHSQTGFYATIGPGSATYQFDWMPPAANAGDITIYVAGNAGVGVPPSQNNDHIYATTYTLKPAAPGPTPAIAAGGVVGASAFGQFAAIAPATWIEIYGSNLAPSAPGAGIQWSGSDFNNGIGPTQLGGVSVSVGGQPTYIAFVAPGQVNAQVPSNVGTGPQNVIVSNGNGASAAYSVTVNATAPGLWAPPFLQIGGKQYVGAFHANGTYVLPAGAIAGIASSPAAVGETILMYGIGFGGVHNPTFSAGQVVTALNTLDLPLLLNFGGTPAPSPAYAGLLPPFVGLYQFNVVVPNVPSGAAVPLTFTLGGAPGAQTLYTAIK
jgi:uncharacterized protein (TIGR03437 family)